MTSDYTELYVSLILFFAQKPQDIWHIDVVSALNEQFWHEPEDFADDSRKSCTHHNGIW